jgi:hypothetical protein
MLKGYYLMPRRPAAVTQADVARTIRAAKQAGADSVRVNPDGTLVVVLKKGPATATPDKGDETKQQDIVL